jgi:hypothetical protein
MNGSAGAAVYSRHKPNRSVAQLGQRACLPSLFARAQIVSIPGRRCDGTYVDVTLAGLHNKSVMQVGIIFIE